MKNRHRCALSQLWKLEAFWLTSAHSGGDIIFSDISKFNVFMNSKKLKALENNSLCVFSAVAHCIVELTHRVTVQSAYYSRPPESNDSHSLYNRIHNLKAQQMVTVLSYFYYNSNPRGRHLWPYSSYRMSLSPQCESRISFIVVLQQVFYSIFLRYAVFSNMCQQLLCIS